MLVLCHFMDVTNKNFKVATPHSPICRPLAPSATHQSGGSRTAPDTIKVLVPGHRNAYDVIESRRCHILKCFMVFIHHNNLYILMFVHPARFHTFYFKNDANSSNSMQTIRNPRQDNC